MLKISNISYKYSDFSLNDINFKMNSGEVLGLYGANASGKSTLIKLISHEYERQSGEIYFNNQYDYRYEMAYIPSYFPFKESYTINNIRKIMKFTYRFWDDSKFDEYLNRYELKKEMKVKKMSLGQRQKLMMVLAMSYGAKLLILDEPSEGIDPFLRTEIINDLRQYIYDNNANLIIATHELEAYESLLDHIIYLENGEAIINCDIINFPSNAREILKLEDELLSIKDFSLARQREMANVKNR